jgi:predicted dehydrogenase
MNDPIRIAVVGASGGMGRARVAQFAGDPRSRVVAACARDTGRLQAAITDESIRLESDAEAIWAAPDVDAVVIASPNTLHPDHCRNAMNAGKHVLCEYPLANSLEEYDSLVALAQEKRLVLHHSLTVRAESLHLALKQALGELGEPRCAYYRYYGISSWYVDAALRGDMFCALHIHFMEQFVDFFGPPTGLHAHGVESDGKVSAVVMMQWPGGLVGTVEFCMGFADKPHYMGTIVTTDGWCGFSSEPVLHMTVGRGGRLSHSTPGRDNSRDEDAATFLDELLGTGPPQCDLATGREAIARCLECSRQLTA